jgi:pSer/pThr/pTyr-binding forkhead associated (FHA) protein
MQGDEDRIVNNLSMDLFREACGMTGPLPLRVEYPGVPEPLQWMLYQPFAIIGREPRAHLQLDHDQVSRRHAYLQVVGGRVFFMDLESRLGTVWESGPRRSGWLDKEQGIQIGPYSIHHASVNGNGTALEAESDSSAPPVLLRHGLPEVTLEFVNRTGRSTTWQMSPMLALVGRSPDCRVHLVGQSVSNFHCSLVRTPLGVWVIDLFGRNGVRVNDQLVRHCRLDHGDRMQVGRFLIQVHYDTPPAGAGRGQAFLRFAAAGWEPAPTDPVSAIQAPEVVVTATPVPPPVVSPEPAADFAAAKIPDLPVLAGEQLPANADAAQHFLVPLAHQLSLMQKQMFDQFQQAMMMMFQMFNTLQRDQISVIREELDHLQGLTKELTHLQAELSKRSQAESPAAAPQVPGTAAAMRAGTPAIPAPKISSEPIVAATAPSAPLKAPCPEPGTSSGTPVDANFHVWLGQRIQAIQQERQSRWQKILHFLGGK